MGGKDKKVGGEGRGESWNCMVWVGGGPRGEQAWVKEVDHQDGQEWWRRATVQPTITTSKSIAPTHFKPTTPKTASATQPLTSTTTHPHCSATHKPPPCLETWDFQTTHASSGQEERDPTWPLAPHPELG